MRTWALGTARAAVLTASFVALGATTLPTGAFADTTNGDSSVLGGNQLNLPVSLPVDASGNAAAAAGSAAAGSKGGSSVKSRGGKGQKTSGKSGVGSGNQVNAPISAPINACGNAIAIFGTADASCRGGASVHNGGGGGQKTSGKSGVGSGNQVNAPVSVPVNACGNAIAIFGTAEAGCAGGAHVINGGKGGQKTSGESGVIAGNQVHAPISAPISVCGNSAAIFGTAVASCEGGAKVKNGAKAHHSGYGTGGQSTSGKSSVGGGNQVNAPVSAPVDVCGNAVGNAIAGCDGSASVRNGGHGSGGQKTDGTSSVLGGNQVNAPVSVPVSACGNAVAVLGEAGAFCEGGAHVHGSSGAGQSTSGTSGVIAGNQVNAPVSVPVNVCGNAVAVLGAGAAACDGTAVVKGSHGPGSTTSGNSSVGGGNQGNAPTKAPTDVCGNTVGVAGHPEPQCDEGPSWGGVIPSTSRTQDAGKVLPGSAPADLPALPSVPKLSKALPLSPTSALPALPRTPALPAERTATTLPAPVDGTTLPGPIGGTTLPGSADGTPLPGPVGGHTLPDALKGTKLPDTSTLTGKLPVGSAKRTPAPTQLPLLGSLPVDSSTLPASLPLNPAALPVDTAALPVNPASLLANPTALPVDAAALPVNSAALPLGSAQRAAAPTGLPLVGTLPVDASTLPELPINTAALPINTTTLPVGSAKRVPGPTQLPLLGSLPVDPATLPASLPLNPAALPLDTAALPVNPASLPVSPAALPVDTAALPVNPASLPVDTGMLPVNPMSAATSVLPAAPAMPRDRAARDTMPVDAAQLPTGTVASQLSNATSQLPNATSQLPTGSAGLPKPDGVVLPSLSKLPVTTDVKVPETPAAGDMVGGVRPVAASEPMNADVKVGALWVLGAALVLTAMSGVLSLTRRIRLGRR